MNDQLDKDIENIVVAYGKRVDSQGYDEGREECQQAIKSLVTKARISEAHRAWIMIGHDESSKAGKRLLKAQYQRIQELTKEDSKNE